MISLAKNILSKAPKNVLVGFGFGVGVGVGVLGTTFAASQNMSSRAHDAAKRAMANAEQAEAREKEALKRDWNENFNLIQQQRKHGPFVVPDKKKKRTKPANWGQKPNPNKEAKPVATKEEKALALADPEAEESPAKENAPVATMEKKVPVVKKEVWRLSLFF